MESLRSGKVTRFLPDSVTPASFGHPVKMLELIETHISWVFLTGDFAYKVKKPVDLGFVDFTTLERRKHFCDEELRLNRRLAEGIYLDVVPIGGSGHQPRFGTSPAFEYALRMRQFDQSARLDERLRAGRLTRDDMVALGESLARLHDAAPVADPRGARGRVRSVAGPIADNYRVLSKIDFEPEFLARLQALCVDDFRRLRRLRATLSARRRERRIRECHGDLHLANIVKIDSRIVPFDCIEFDPELRWIDVMNEAAFPFMDLACRGRTDLAYAFLNAYLQQVGDYPGVSLLNLYVSYRAMIRMKVAAMNDSLTRAQKTEKFCRQLACAERFTLPCSPRLVLTHGLAGSGKTFLTNDLMVEMAAVRIRSDVERKRLVGLAATTHSESPVEAGLYAPALTRRTYAHLRDLARTVIAAGHHVIVDAASLKRWQRDLFATLAADSGVPFTILSCTASEDLLRQRLDNRRRMPGVASEADQPVLDRQLETAEPLGEAERAAAIVIDTEHAVSVKAVCAAVLADRS